MEALKKMVPSFSDELIHQLPLAFEVGVNDLLTLSDFKRLLDPRE
jgi:hypothetical protein